MGQAKVRAGATDRWLRSLPDEERIVATTAIAAYQHIVRPLGALGVTGMCYRMAFFLTTFLTQEYSITVRPIVGYAHDGETELMAPHAWIEFNSKKVDISLTMTEHPDVQLPGPLLILDRKMSFGAEYAIT